MRWIGAAPAALLLACAPAARPASSAPPTPSPAPVPCVDPPDVGDLSGSWMMGLTGDPPPVREMVLHVECANHPAQWLLEQSGSEIRGWEFPASFDQGIATNESPARLTPDAGRICGRDVVLGDRFRLVYEPESGHLRGTRDGKPFWAVRQRVVGPGPCPGIP